MNAEKPPHWSEDDWKAFKKSLDPTETPSDDDLIRMMNAYDIPVEVTTPPEVKPKPLRNELPELDLHHHTVEQAIAATRSFLQKHRNHTGIQKVKIITGKGLRSADYQPRIKPAIEDLLRTEFKSVIRSFKQAPPHQGGSGALVVWFKR